jgi:hypothetical protein
MYYRWRKTLSWRLHSSSDYLLRPLNAIGYVLIYCALFLYEGEEGRIQNLIVQWWVKVDDARAIAGSWARAFIQAVARLTVRGFDRVLGERLFSFRFAGVSLCLSIASIFLLASFGAIRVHQSAGRPLVWAVSWMAFAFVPAIYKGIWVSRLWGLCLVLLVALPISSGFLFFVYLTRGGGFVARGVAYAILPLLVSFGCDVSYVALTRGMLRRASSGGTGYALLFLVAGNLLALGVLLLGPIFLGLWVSRYWLGAGAAIGLSFCLNAVDFFAGSAALFVAASLVVHRLLWPLVERPLYALQRYHVITNKKLLWTAGLALALLPTHATLSAFKALLGRL